MSKTKKVGIVLIGVFLVFVLIGVGFLVGRYNVIVMTEGEWHELSVLKEQAEYEEMYAELQSNLDKAR